MLALQVLLVQVLQVLLALLVQAVQVLLALLVQALQVLLALLVQAVQVLLALLVQAVQVVPAQGGLRVVVVLVACLFPPFIYFPQRRICCNNCLSSSLEYERCCEYNNSISRGSLIIDWISPGVFLAISSLVRSWNCRTFDIRDSLTLFRYKLGSTLFGLSPVSYTHLTLPTTPYV